MGSYDSWVRVPPWTSSATARRLTEADETIRGAIPAGTRIAVVARTGGAGTTTIAAVLCIVLARRGGPVLGIGAGAGPTALAGFLDVPAGSAHDVDIPGADSGKDATTALPRSPSGARMMGLVDEGGDPWFCGIDRWARHLGTWRPYFDTVVTDAGYRTPDEIDEVIGHSDVVVRVVRCGPRCWPPTPDEGPFPGLARVVDVHVDVGASPTPCAHPRRIPHDLTAARSLGRLPDFRLPTRVALFAVVADVTIAARAGAE